MTAAVMPPVPPRGAVLASRLARSCRVRPCRASRLAGWLLGVDPIGNVAELVRVIFPAPAERAELDQLVARHLAAAPAPSVEAARVRAFIDLVGERRFPVDDFVLWDDEAATYDALLEGIPFARYGWSYDDLHAEPDEQRPGHNLLRALTADPDDGLGGIAGRGALLDHLARTIPSGLLAPLAAGGRTANSLRSRLGGTRFAPAADFARWIVGDTGLICLDYNDDGGGGGEAPWSRHNVALLTAQWPHARALLARVNALVTWLETAAPARFAALLVAAGLAPASGAAGGPP